MKTMLTALLSCGVIYTATAVPNNPPTLNSAQTKVIQNYVAALANHDAVAISQLFTSGGYVVSMSKGRVDARKFFGEFLPNIATAHSELHGYFRELNQTSCGVNLKIESGCHPRLAAQFHFDYTMKDDPQPQSGEFVDIFEFEPSSNLLQAVYMFGNDKFNN
jgi:hypothetical protein